MQSKKIILFCDRTMVFAICASIYFLPISSALIESFFVVAFISFLVKRFAIFFCSFHDESFSRGRDVFARVVDKFHKAFKLSESSLNQSIGWFTFFVFLSILNSQYPVLSLRGFFFKVLQETFTFFIFIECINSVKRLRTFLTIFLISFVLIITDGIYQSIVKTDFIFHHAYSDFRLTASLKHGNDFGAYLVFVFPVLLSMIFYRRKKIILSMTSKTFDKEFSFFYLSFWSSHLFV